MHRFRKKCKDFVRNAKISLQVQRNSLQLQEQNFLTSGEKLHLGGLGGKWAVASDNYSPLISTLYISPYMSGGWEKKGEKNVYFFFLGYNLWV